MINFSEKKAKQWRKVCSSQEFLFIPVRIILVEVSILIKYGIIGTFFRRGWSNRASSHTTIAHDLGGRCNMLSTMKIETSLVIWSFRFGTASFEYISVITRMYYIYLKRCYYAEVSRYIYIICDVNECLDYSMALQKRMHMGNGLCLYFGALTTKRLVPSIYNNQLACHSLEFRMFLLLYCPTRACFFVVAIFG